MTEFDFSNNAESTLAQAIGGGDVSLQVATGDGALFPGVSAPDGKGFYILVIEGSTKEWMLVTVRSGDTLSGIIRGGANAFGAGATVRHAINATVLQQFLQKGVYRETATDPDGVLVADYTGEEVLQSTTDIWWKHVSSLLWKAMSGT